MSPPQLLQIERPWGFDAYGIQFLIAKVAILLTATTLIVVFVRSGDVVLRWLVGILSTMTVVTAILGVIDIGLSFVGTQAAYAVYSWLFEGAAVWTTLLVARALFGWLDYARVPRIASALLWGALVFGSALLLPATWIVFTKYDEPAVADALPPVNVEAVYYEQYRLLDGALGALLPERPEQADVYFVGYGSYASQDVFVKEIAFARHLFEERFDAGGRAMTLMNHRDTLETFPLANAPNLAFALEELAEVMNPEKDLLVLFLTSHGSKEGELAARFRSVRPNDLRADDPRCDTQK